MPSILRIDQLLRRCRERGTLSPYLDPTVERLLNLLNPAGDPARSAGTGDHDANYGDGSK